MSQSDPQGSTPIHVIFSAHFPSIWEGFLLQMSYHYQYQDHIHSLTTYSSIQVQYHKDTSFVSDRKPKVVILDPAVSLCYSRTSWGTQHGAWVVNQEQPRFLFGNRDIWPKNTHLCEWMKLSIGQLLQWPQYNILIGGLMTEWCVRYVMRVFHCSTCWEGVLVSHRGFRRPRCAGRPLPCGFC